MKYIGKMGNNVLIPGPERMSVHPSLWVNNAYYFRRWADRAKRRLLTVTAQDIDWLSRQHYSGCGFHYDMERQLGKLLIELSIPNKHTDIGMQVIYEVLCFCLNQSVAKAKASVRKIP